MNKQEVAKALQLITTDNDFRNALSKMSQNQPLFEAFTKIVLYADKKYGEGNLSEADLLVGQQGESKTNDDSYLTHPLYEWEVIYSFENTFRSNTKYLKGEMKVGNLPKELRQLAFDEYAKTFTTEGEQINWSLVEQKYVKDYITDATTQGREFWRIINDGYLRVYFAEPFFWDVMFPYKIKDKPFISNVLTLKDYPLPRLRKFLDKWLKGSGYENFTMADLSILIEGMDFNQYDNIKNGRDVARLLNHLLKAIKKDDLLGFYNDESTTALLIIYSDETPIEFINKATPSLKVPNGKYGGYIGKSSLLSGYEMPVYGKTPLKDYPITQNPWTDNWESDGLRPSPTRTANSGEDEFGLGNNGEVYSNPKNAKGVRQWKRIKWGGVNIDTISPNFNEVLRDGNFKKEDYELLLTMYVSEMRYANQEDDEDLFNKTLTRVIELDYIYYDKFDVQ